MHVFNALLLLSASAVVLGSPASPGIRASCPQNKSFSNGRTCRPTCGSDRPGGDYANKHTGSFQACIDLCGNDSKCVTAQYHRSNGYCYLKNSSNKAVSSSGTDSVDCSAPGQSTSKTTSTKSTKTTKMTSTTKKTSTTKPPTTTTTTTTTTTPTTTTTTTEPPTTTEVPTTTTSTGTPTTTSTDPSPSPTTCAQLGGVSYTAPNGSVYNLECKHAINIDIFSLIEILPAENFRACIDRCSLNTRCRAVNFVGDSLQYGQPNTCLQFSTRSGSFPVTEDSDVAILAFP